VVSSSIVAHIGILIGDFSTGFSDLPFLPTLRDFFKEPIARQRFYNSPKISFGK
jgi:hypothetical protein